MSASPAVRRRALRTAALSTAVVGVLLLLVLVITDVLVVRDLNGGVDDRLRDQLRHGSGRPAIIGGDSDVDEPVLRWSIAADGSVTADSSVPLPAELRGLSGFTTTSISGTPFRAAGERSGGADYVVAASLAPVANALRALVLTELVVGPLLLAAVFAGSFAIGRRVATPVEAMRRRQLDFTADASHELRTPLTVIQAETSLLHEDAEGDTRASLERISAEAKRMRHIVDDLLWLARSETEPDARRAEPVDLAEIARVAADRFRTVAAQRDVDLRVAVPEDGGVVVHAAPEWLDRLAGVLVDNACRYSRDGGGVVVEVSAPGGHPRLAVRDSGPGVPPEERARIFARFHRATTSGEGSGLGLAIADAVVRATDGRWEISNLREGGAEFAVSWRR